MLPASSIQLICLVTLSSLSLKGWEAGLAACPFHLFHDPVPIPDAQATAFQTHSEFPNGTPLVLYAHLPTAQIVSFVYGKLRIVFVGIASYDIVHLTAPFLFTI
jgi:hypothetical protein